MHRLRPACPAFLRRHHRLELPSWKHILYEGVPSGAGWPTRPGYFRRAEVNGRFYGSDSKRTPTRRGPSRFRTASSFAGQVHRYITHYSAGRRRRFRGPRARAAMALGPKLAAGSGQMPAGFRTQQTTGSTNFSASSAAVSVCRHVSSCATAPVRPGGRGALAAANVASCLSDAPRLPALGGGDDRPRLRSNTRHTPQIPVSYARRRCTAVRLPAAAERGAAGADLLRQRREVPRSGRGGVAEDPRLASARSRIARMARRSRRRRSQPDTKHVGPRARRPRRTLSTLIPPSTSMSSVSRGRRPRRGARRSLAAPRG